MDITASAQLRIARDITGNVSRVTTIGACGDVSGMGTSVLGRFQWTG